MTFEQFAASLPDILDRPTQVMLLDRYHKTKDPDDLRRIVDGNHRLVVHWINKLCIPPDERFDAFLEGIGAGGLMKAVEKFDPNLGNQFSTYASFWIQKAIKRGYDQRHHYQGIFDLPVYLRSLLVKLTRQTKKLNLDETNLSESDIIGLIECRPGEAASLRHVLNFKSPVQLDAPHWDNRDYHDLIPDEFEESAPPTLEVFGEDWHRAFSALSKTQQRLLKLLLDEELNLAEAANVMGFKRS